MIYAISSPLSNPIIAISNPSIRRCVIEPRLGLISTLSGFGNGIKSYQTLLCYSLCFKSFTTCFKLIPSKQYQSLSRPPSKSPFSNSYCGGCCEAPRQFDNESSKSDNHSWYNTTYFCKFHSMMKSVIMF